jgi:NAD(P)-dependent dehydrogenase (short-subunit alcohol dehydrogenase family)
MNLGRGRGVSSLGWSVADIPDQSGRIAVVTGPGGLGFETALGLAGAGARVILAGRNPEKGAAAVAAIKAKAPQADVAFTPLDLASLASVKACGAGLLNDLPRLDLLINNAGVMAPPTRQETADGFELQFGVNYLGHFALTARLLPLLRQGVQPRVVSLSSVAHKVGAIRFPDLQWRYNYSAWGAYGQSKLAMLMFALELQRRSDAAGWGLTSLAAHPGFARTELIANGPAPRGVMAGLNRLLQPMVSQSAAQGALPTLFAATAAAATGGGYYGPNGVFELQGAPAPAQIMPKAQRRDDAARLWQESARLTSQAFV